MTKGNPFGLPFLFDRYCNFVNSELFLHLPKGRIFEADSFHIERVILRVGVWAVSQRMDRLFPKILPNTYNKRWNL